VRVVNAGCVRLDVGSFDGGGAAHIAGYGRPSSGGLRVPQILEDSCPVWRVRRHHIGVTMLTKAEVFARHGIELTRFATSLVGPTDAQDVVSDALVRAMWSDGWGDVGNQRAYLYRAVVSQARML
jgi:hypothetical protein